MKKTNKMMAGVLTTLVASTMTGCNTNTTISDDYYIEETSFESDMMDETKTIYEQTSYNTNS